MRCIPLWSVLALTVGGMATVGHGIPKKSTGPIVLQRCLPECKQATQLGASVPGILPDCNVHLDEQVKGIPKKSTGPIVLRRCLLECKQATQLGASVPGILQDCNVHLGEQVKTGQVLGRLQGLEQQAEQQYRAADATSDSKVKVAAAKHDAALATKKAGAPDREGSDQQARVRSHGS